MARVTVEDCLDKVPNRFALTVLSSRRARALSEGKGTAQVKSNNKVGVVALREIAKGLVRYTEEIQEVVQSFIDEQRAQVMAGSNSDATFIDAANFASSEDDEEEEDDDVKELSTDPDKLQDDEDEDEDSDDDAEPDDDAETEDEDADSVDDELADDVDPAVLEDLDDDISDDDIGDDDSDDDDEPADDDD